MVEKWLLQVQVTMIQSLKDVTERSVAAYTTTPREKWVLSWPGQVSPTCSGLVVVCLSMAILCTHILKDSLPSVMGSELSLDQWILIQYVRRLEAAVLGVTFNRN